MSRFQLLTDAQWSLIADLLPAPTGRRGRPFADARQMVEGIIYRYRCGIAWRDLPETFGKWQTVWTWHRRMSADGTWDAVLTRLLSAAHAAGLIDWTTPPTRALDDSRASVTPEVEREYEQMAARLKQEVNAIQPLGFIAPGQLTPRGPKGAD